ncbi:CocE/NonD family hydrolase [Stenotrophomonas sp.]|uniref:CocE/NonD family hydrolase n=1 Tax=Stenotrophomonas sp. TaxID=69392 RepID=UPI0028B118BC|nr:CocE/NonD family hydrolase [Stenotrophomonas sp.]
MRYLLGVLLFLTVGTSFAQSVSIPLPAQLHHGARDAGMRQFSKQVLQLYREDDAAQYLDNVFRLQLAAGLDAEAVASIRQLRALRAGPGQQPPLYLQYEIYTLARQRAAASGTPFALHWPVVFAEQFGRLDDRTALQAEYAFGSHLPRLRAELDTQLAKIAGQNALPLSDALKLIRAWQVQRAYTDFQPQFASALAADDQHRYLIDRHLMIPAEDGTGLASILVRPRQAPVLPTLLTFTIYANDDWAWADAKTMAAHGYASLVSYSRGKGRSSAAIVPFEQDGPDAAAVVGWAAAQPWSDGRVGMYGGSYSGYTQWAALKQRPPALKAIATSATTAPGIDVPMEGGVFLNFMYAWPHYTSSNRGLDEVSYGDSERWNRLNSRWFRSGRAYRELPAIDGAANPVFQRWLQHPQYDAYWQAMIPQEEEFAAIDIPVLVTTGYFDGAQIGALHYFRQHLKYRPDADHSLLIGPYEHFTMQTGVPPQVQGYTPEPSARLDLQALRLDWFDHVFKGAAKPALLADRVNWQVMGADRWRHARTLQAMGNGRRRLYLQPGADNEHRLLATPAQAATTLQQVDYSTRDDADWQPSSNVLNPGLDPHAGLVFRSDVLSEDLELAGPFTAELDFNLNKVDADISIAIYEQTADGNYLDLAYALQRLSHVRDPRQRHLLAPGSAQHASLRDTRLLGRRLAAGSRVVVTLGVLKQPNLQLNLGSGKAPSDETIADAGTPLRIQWHGSSYVELPVRE